MTKKRKQFLDDLWMNSEVGRWATAKAYENKEESDKILNEVFEKGYLKYRPVLVSLEQLLAETEDEEKDALIENLMQQEKMLSDKVKNELKNDDEAKAYCLALEEENYDLVGVMIAYEFSMLDLLYTADRQQ